MSARWLVSAVLVASAGCHADPSTGDAAMAIACSADEPACACSPRVDIPPFEGAAHVVEPTMVTYQNNPPASGPHWPMWETSYGSFPGGLARERWVHNLEHGGVVLLYNCPSGCDADVQQLEALRNARHPDQWNEVRILIVPDAQMQRAFAAVAWKFRWQDDVVDAAAINCFLDARYDHGPESTP